MKQTLLALFVAAIALTGCGGKSLTINGTVADSTLNGETVYMTDIVTDSILDSTVVVDAKFTFNRNVDSLYILRLNIDRAGATVLVEEGTVNVELGNPSKTSGLPLNDMLAQYVAQSDSIEADFSGRYQVLSAAIKGLEGEELTAANKALEETVNEMSKQYQAENKALNDKFMLGNENNALGIMLQMNALTSRYDYELPQIDSMLAISNPVVAKIARVQSMRESAVARQNTSEGDMFVDFEGVTASGEPTKLSDFVGKGNYVLLDFWASWCGPCRRAMPEIKAIYEKYKDKGFVVVGANVWDSKEGFEKAIGELELPWAQICNFESRTPTELYGVIGIPQLILFAPDGTIVKRELDTEYIDSVYKK